MDSERKFPLRHPGLIFGAVASAGSQVVFGVTAFASTLPLNVRLAMLVAIPSGVLTAASFMSDFSDNSQQVGGKVGKFNGLWLYLTIVWFVDAPFLPWAT